MKRLALIIGFIAAVIYGRPALANQSANAAAYCTPPNTISNGNPVTAPPLQNNFQHAEACQLMPGLIYTDGPLYAATFSFTGSSFAFTIPANNWVQKGQAAYSASTALTAPTSTTTYYFLECNGCSGVTPATWETNTTSTPPDAYAELMYTITTNGSGITGVTNPTPASVIFNTIQQTGTNITAGWLQYGTLGSASTNVLRFGNNGSSGYTALGASNALTISGITDTVFGVNDTGTAQAVLDHSGNFAIAGAYYGSGAHLTSIPVCSTCAVTNANNNFSATQSVTGDVNATGKGNFGSGTAATLSAGDVGASRSTTTGKFIAGGSSSSCAFDWNLSNSGAGTFGCGVFASNYEDTGLASSSTLPLCAPNNANITQCGAGSIPNADLVTNPAAILYQTTGTTSAATGTSANTYIQLGSNVSITTGTSSGTNGNWLVTLTMYLSGSTGSNASTIYGCMESASTFTTKDFGATTTGAHCTGSPANAFMGGPKFGETSAAGDTGLGLAQTVIGHVTVANSTTAVFSCWVASDGAVSITVWGYCSAQAVQF